MYNHLFMPKKHTCNDIVAMLSAFFVAIQIPCKFSFNKFIKNKFQSFEALKFICFRLAHAQKKIPKTKLFFYRPHFFLMRSAAALKKYERQNIVIKKQNSKLWASDFFYSGNFVLAVIFRTKCWATRFF